jgi:hypothetical protein
MGLQESTLAQLTFDFPVEQFVFPASGVKLDQFSSGLAAKAFVTCQGMLGGYSAR